MEPAPDPEAAPGRGLHLERRRARPALVGAGVGALWGAVAFSVLWGYSGIEVDRQFVNSLPGLLSLLPVRVVLYAIRAVEVHVVRHPFVFAQNHQWIGYVAAGTGALMGLAAAVLGRGVVRWARARTTSPRPAGA
jgi:hypothetical protein